jgi:2-hydroxychromene-2-carboxylate isomerase
MPAPIDFYFDFSSPYGYLASEKIEAIAENHGRSVKFKPILLGVVFKQTGASPLTSVPLKGDYSRRDFMRSARLLGVPFRMPASFPISTQVAARIVLWLAQSNAESSRAAMHALYRAYFVDGIDISEPGRAIAIAAQVASDPAAIGAAVESAPVKDGLRRANEEAIAAGVCGSPFMVVDGEPFWGSDRLAQVDRWLASGGW